MNAVKIILFTVMTNLISLNYVCALEKGNFYISGSYGTGVADKFSYNDEDFASKKPSNADVLNFAMGYGITDNIRAEMSYVDFYGLKYKYAKTGVDEANNLVQYLFNQKVKAEALFISAYYDINKFGKVKPYVTVGVGLAKVKAGDINYQINQENSSNRVVGILPGLCKKQFAWQIGTGMNYTVNDKVNISIINYRYNKLGKAKFRNLNEKNAPIISTKLVVHSITTGIIFKF